MVQYLSYPTSTARRSRNKLKLLQNNPYHVTETRQQMNRQSSHNDAAGQSQMEENIVESASPFTARCSVPSTRDSSVIQSPEKKLNGEADVLNHQGSKFLSDCLLDESPPALNWVDFVHPRLRKFPRYNEKIRWFRHEGEGLKGGVYKAYFGDHGPYAIKIVRFQSRVAEGLY
jgi:hypothetical protein